MTLHHTYDDSTSSSSYTALNFVPLTRNVRKNGKVVVEKHYGPIVVKPRKNPAPTLASGRKSKYAQLNSEEAIRREVRRTRNRQAAEKCKLKRNEIEDKLQGDLAKLESERKRLSHDNEMLSAKKARLQKLFDDHTKACTLIIQNQIIQNAVDNATPVTNHRANTVAQMTAYSAVATPQQMYYANTGSSLDATSYDLGAVYNTPSTGYVTGQHAIYEQQYQAMNLLQSPQQQYQHQQQQPQYQMVYQYDTRYQ